MIPHGLDTYVPGRLTVEVTVKEAHCIKLLLGVPGVFAGLIVEMILVVCQESSLRAMVRANKIRTSTNLLNGLKILTGD